MMNKMRRTAICALLILVCVATTPKARAMVQHSPPGGWVLLNGENITVIFSLSDDNQKTWYPFTLAPKQEQTYGSTTGSSNFHIKIKTTNGAVVKYRLTAKERYKIKWDSILNRWEVVRLVTSKSPSRSR